MMRDIRFRTVASRMYHFFFVTEALEKIQALTFSQKLNHSTSFGSCTHSGSRSQPRGFEVASCWGQFYVVSESVREAQAQAHISEMVDKELRRFKEEMARAEREEKERLERVYSAIVKPQAPEEFEPPSELNTSPSADAVKALGGQISENWS